MRRVLLTISGKKCPYKCRYCFANFKQYEKGFTLHDVERNRDVLRDVEIIYPACDIELFAGGDPVGTLERAAALGCSISVSTKAPLSHELVEGLAEISYALAERGHVLKIGVAFSTKYNIPQLEAGTADYEARLDNLDLLNKFGIPTCVVLKPVVVEIPITEYCEIIQDVSHHGVAVLVGEEYIDVSALRTLGRKRPFVKLDTRDVNWLQTKPRWPISKAENHIHQIKSFAESKGLKCFDSDLELMEWLVLELTKTVRVG